MTDYNINLKLLGVPFNAEKLFELFLEELKHSLKVAQITGMFGTKGSWHIDIEWENEDDRA